jgi:hypothetical protein
MRTLILLTFLNCSCYVNAQENLQIHIEDGKFYGIFPVVVNNVVYSDSIVLTGSVGRESLYDQAKAFFDKREDAKYYFESEDSVAGELVYQGELNKSIMSQNSDVHFNIMLRFSDSSCWIKLYEVVIASPRPHYSPSIGYGSNGAQAGVVKADAIDSATPLENITVGKGEYSVRYCEKINKRFKGIMDGLNNAFR